MEHNVSYYYEKAEWDKTSEKNSLQDLEKYNLSENEKNPFRLSN